MKTMESKSLDGIWPCSADFHTDGLVYYLYQPPVPLSVSIPGGELHGYLGPMHVYWCTIHHEYVHFAAE